MSLNILLFISLVCNLCDSDYLSNNALEYSSPRCQSEYLKMPGAHKKRGEEESPQDKYVTSDSHERLTSTGRFPDVVILKRT